MTPLGFFIYLPGGRMLHMPAHVSKIAYWHDFYIEPYTFENDENPRRDTRTLDETELAAVLAVAREHNVEIRLEPDGRTVIGWNPYLHIQDRPWSHLATPSPTASASPTGEISRVI
jgi:hypothetical protein